MERLSTSELAARVDGLWDEVDTFHPWHEPGVTATTPIPLDASTDLDGSNRAYAELQTEGAAPDPAAITVDDTMLVVRSEGGVDISLRLDDLSVVVRSWTRLRISASSTEFDLEFHPSTEVDTYRSRKAMAIALAAVTTVGLAGVGGMAAGTQLQLRLAFRRFPMLYRHLERHAGSFEPMAWWHRNRILYTTLGTAGCVFFLLAVPLFLCLGFVLPGVFAAIFAGPILRDGLAITDVPSVLLISFATVALGAAFQSSSAASASVHWPFFFRLLSGRGAPWERAFTAAAEFGNKQTGSFMFREFGKVSPNWLLLVTPVSLVAMTASDVSRQGEPGLAKGGVAVMYFGALALSLAVYVAFAVRFALITSSTLLNKLLWVRDHRRREQTVLVWTNARLVIVVAVVTAIMMLGIPPLFAP